MENEQPRRVAAYCRVGNYSQVDIDPLDMQVALVKEYAQGRGEGTIPLPPIRDPTNSFSSTLRGGDAVEG